nr:hypothetical protein [uncultured Roseateles sp.]
MQRRIIAWAGSAAIAALSIYVAVQMQSEERGVASATVAPPSFSVDNSTKPISAPHTASQPASVAIAVQRQYAAYKVGDAAKLWASSPEALFNVYKHGRESESAVEKYLALQALSFCLPIAMNRANNQLPADAVLNMVSVYRSRNELQERCRLFFGVSHDELRKANTELLAAVNDGSSPVNAAAMELRRDESDARTIKDTQSALLRTLENHKSDALLWAGPGLGTWLEHAAGNNALRGSIDPVLLQTDHIAEAMMIAMCDMGYDCGKDSLLYMRLCATAAQCSASVAAQVLENLPSDASRQLVKQQARVIAEAIATKQFVRLGLH